LHRVKSSPSYVASNVKEAVFVTFDSYTRSVSGTSATFILLLFAESQPSRQLGGLRVYLANSTEY